MYNCPCTYEIAISLQDTVSFYFADINECHFGNSECDHFCDNLDCQDGQYECSCRPGYHLGSDEHTCIGKRIQLLLEEIVSNNNDNLQWCGNSQSCRTLSDKSSECPVNGNLTVYEVYGEQDKSGDNRPKCLAIGSLFPHP